VTSQNKTPKQTQLPQHQRKSRLTALVIDFTAVTLAMAPFAALIPLAAEWLRSGHFAWSFQRKYTVASDFYIGFPLVFVIMGLLAVYFAWPIARDRQTLGCYALRLKVTPDESIRGRFGLSQGLRRVFLGFIGLCSLPFMVRSSHGDLRATICGRTGITC
jgi:hypothetical protein